MIIMFHFSNQERLIYIPSQVENHLEVSLMEDNQEEDYLTKIHPEDCHIIHMLDFMDVNTRFKDVYATMVPNSCNLIRTNK